MARKTVRQVLATLYHKHGSYRAVAEAIGPTRDGRLINPGYLSQIARGERRASNAVLARLKLPLNPVPYEPCKRCGQAKSSKRCPHCRKRIGWSERRIADQPAFLLIWRLLNRETVK